MSGSGTFESLAVIIRAAEGLGLLALSGVVFAVGYIIERRATGTAKGSSRTARVPGRAR